MNNAAIYPAISTPAVDVAATFLTGHGVAVTQDPAAATHFLYPVPTPHDITPPDHVTIIGGKLDFLGDRPKWDLLQDMRYLAINAAITAHCAMALGADALTDTFFDLPVLVIGWGRIGKCLASQLKAAGCRVSVAARKARDRAMLEALSYAAMPMDALPRQAEGCPLLYNTVPAPVLDTTGLSCVAIDLASTPGLTGTGVIRARGLPGKMAPKAAGHLMGETVLRRWKEEIL